MPTFVILLIVFFILLFLNVPVGFCLGGASLAALIFGMGIPLEVIAQRFFVTFDSFTMMAIPLFMLAGTLMNGSGISERILNLADMIVGHISGGLAQANILASMMFAGISGSAAADAAGLGSIEIPGMVKRGYDKDFSVVVTATSSCIGPIIPPSIMFVIYASIANLSVGRLFMAGVLPGVTIGIALMITTWFISKKREYPVSPKPTAKEFFTAFLKAIDALIMPIIIVGGVLSGVFTATESGAVAVLYALIIGFVRKELTFKRLCDAVMEAALQTGAMMLIIASAAVFGWLLTISKFPQLVVSTLFSLSSNTVVITFLILLILLIIGMFLDGTSAMVILVPILAPLIAQYGFDPIHFSSFMIVTLLIGGITPPVGILLYISCGIAQIEVKESFRMLAPYLITMIIVAILVGLIPGISTFLPNLIYG